MPSSSTRPRTPGTPEHERSLLWRDSTLHIDWPLQGEPLLAAKDAGAKALREAEVFA